MWQDRFLEIPFCAHGRSYSGCDCWGLVYLIEKDVFSVPVPILNTEYTTLEPEEISSLVDRELATSFFAQVDTPQEGDIVLMRIIGSSLPRHVGVYINGGFVVHSDPIGRGLPRVQRLTSPAVAQYVEGFYRVRGGNLQASI